MDYKNNARGTTLEKTNELLKEKLLHLAPKTGRYFTAIDGLVVTRFDEVTTSENCFYEPSIGVVVQGFTHSRLGSKDYRCGEMHCLVMGVDMPGFYRIATASREEPFLAVSINVDRSLATQLSAELPLALIQVDRSGKGVSVGEVDSEVLDAFLRLTETLGNAEQVSVLAPLIIQEIHYRIMIGSLGDCLRGISTLGTHSNNVALAITWLRDNYKAPIHIETLASMAKMPISTFHRQFKRVTSLSPLQFQKRLRLYEAQRLMLTDDIDATSASSAVGYESPTQFNREYKRLFGEPPYRNIKKSR